MMEIQSRLVATTSTFKHKVSESLYRIQFSDNVVYEGGINRQTNIPYGYGKLMLKDEAVYQGEWRNGLFHGWGKLVLRMFHKKGQLERKSVEEVTGNFTDGILNGPATLVFVNGNRFMGVIKNGIIESEGTLTSEKGISIGTWSCSSLVASL